MNGLLAEARNLAGGIAAGAAQASPACELLICPPAQLLFPVAAALEGSSLALGGQDCHPAQSGAHTGDISAAMLRDAGCRYVILGHSERRQDHGETSALVQAKAAAALAAGLSPIVCVGETEAERESGRAMEVVEAQLRQSLPASGGPALVIAYEPVWAIGTGKTATPTDVETVHRGIRARLTELLDGAAAASVRILYGGSVKPANAAELMAVPDVDGALVGGASLKAEDFLAIAARAG